MSPVILRWAWSGGGWPSDNGAAMSAMGRAIEGGA